MRELDKIKESAPETDLWEVVVPKVKAALEEAVDQAAMDREEIETLWWLFAAYSETERKPLGDLSPFAAAFAPVSNWRNELYCRRLSFGGHGEARGRFRAQGRESRGNCLGRHSD